MKRSAPAILLAAVLAGGCAAPPVRVDVPFHEQEDGHCGEAALAMLLDHAGKPADPALLRRRLHLPALNGTVTDLMVEVSREQGVPARKINAPDRAAAGQSLAAPMAVLLGPFHQGRVGHYVVVTGYQHDRWVSVHSGQTRNLRMGWSKFMDRWAESEYEALVLNP